MWHGPQHPINFVESVCVEHKLMSVHISMTYLTSVPFLDSLISLFIVVNVCNLYYCSRITLPALQLVLHPSLFMLVHNTNGVFQ